MDRVLAVELESEARPHYFHMDGEDRPSEYRIPADLYERILRHLRGENGSYDW